MLADEFLKKHKIFEEERKKKYEIELNEILNFNKQEEEKATFIFENSLKKELTNKIMYQANNKIVELEINKDLNRDVYSRYLYKLVKEWLITEGFNILYENTIYESIKLRIGVKE